MANYTKTTIGKENRIELHEKLSLTGAEISLNELPAGANVPFVHSHKENEEIYGILSGNGKAIIDGEEISLSTGDWLKIAPAAKRQFFCIRYFWNYLYLHSGKRKFSGTFYSRGCRNRLIKSIYLQKCTAPDKLRTVHFFLKFYDFSIFYIRSYGFNFLQIISFRIIHTTTKTATKAPSNSNSVYHGADCMTYKFG